MTTMTLETARTLDSRMPTLEDVGAYATLGLAMAVGGPLLLAYALVPAALLAIVGLSAKTFESIRKGWNRFRRGTGIDLVGVQEHNDPPLSVRFAPLVIDATPPDVLTNAIFVCEEPMHTWQETTADVVCDATAPNGPVDPPAARKAPRKRSKWVTTIAGTVRYTGTSEKEARRFFVDYRDDVVPHDDGTLTRDGEVVDSFVRPAPAPKKRRRKTAD